MKEPSQFFRGKFSDPSLVVSAITGSGEGELIRNFTDYSQNWTFWDIIKFNAWNGSDVFFRMSDDYATKRIFLVKPIGVRRRGTPRLRWMDCLQNDFVSINVKERRNNLVFLRKPGSHQDCRATDDDDD